MFNKSLFCIAILCAVLTGCASAAKRAVDANLIASNANMQAEEINTGQFILTTYAKILDKNQPVNIYIEGDGFARATVSRLSSNPTPLDAFTLKLAAKDPSANVIYIARPCQYTSLAKDSLCEAKYWSGSRFSEKVITSVNAAISHYAKQFPKAKINLIGYSGGAAVAVLIAARRNDITSLRTVAGNLDHEAVNKHHQVDSLNDSLNPIDVAGKIASLPQYHFAGANDKTIPLSVIEAFAKKSEQGKGCVRVSSVNGATHNSGWEENWPQLLAQPVFCKSNLVTKKTRIN